jgi:hypothetical protein
MSLDGHDCKCGKCIIGSNQTKYSVYGDKTIYILENNDKKTVSKFVVDDCLLKDLGENEKCDYLFVHSKVSIFVELKGSNVPKAINQLISSITHLRNRIGGALFGRIVCSKFKKAPAIKGSREYRQLVKLTNDNLVIKSVQLIESV